jgi:uncharacterized protein DUF742
MTPEIEQQQWLDEPLVRPFAVTGGRTRTEAVELDLITLVVAMRAPEEVPDLDPEYEKLLEVSQQPISVVEIAAHVDLPLQVVKVLLSDLITQKLMIFRSSVAAADAPSVEVLQAVLHGIRRL